MDEEVKIIIGMEIILGILVFYHFTRIIRHLFELKRTKKVNATIVDVIEGGTTWDPDMGMNYANYYEVYEFYFDGKSHRIKAAFPSRDTHRPIGTKVKIRIDLNDFESTAPSMRWIILHLILLGTYLLSGILVWSIM